MKRLTLTAFALLLSPIFCQAQELDAAQELDTQSKVSDDPSLVVSKPGVVLGFDEVDARMLRVPADKRAGFINDPQRIEQMLQNLLLMKQLANQAREEGLDQDPLIQAELQIAQDEVLANRLAALQRARVSIPDFTAVALDRYNAAPEVFDTKDVIDVRHFVIKRDIHGEAQARKIATDLRNQFVVEGGDFEAFVKQHSEEPNAELHGGLLKGLVRGKTAESFDRAAFALKEAGELSPVVATDFGFHVIELIDRKPGRRLSFEEVKDQLLQTLIAEYRSRKQDEFLFQFQSQTLTANPDNVQSLRTRYLPEAEGTLRLKKVEGALDTATSNVTGQSEADTTGKN